MYVTADTMFSKLRFYDFQTVYEQTITQNVMLGGLFINHIIIMQNYKSILY